MGIWINGADVSKSPFAVSELRGMGLGYLFCNWNAPVKVPVEYGSNCEKATDADFKVWSITGGLPVDFCSDSRCDCGKFMQGKKSENRTDDDKESNA